MKAFDLNDLIAEHQRQDHNQDTNLFSHVPPRLRAGVLQINFPLRWIGREVAVREHMQRYHAN